MPSRRYSSCSCFSTNSAQQKQINQLNIISTLKRRIAKPTNEQLLQFLIAIVDTKLLETVRIEYFEAVNIQYADDFIEAFRSIASRHNNCLVYPLNDPCEQSVIDGFCQCIAAIFRLLCAVRFAYDVTVSGNNALCQRIRHFVFGHVEQFGCIFQCVLVRHHQIVFVHCK